MARVDFLEPKRIVVDETVDLGEVEQGRRVSASFPVRLLRDRPEALSVTTISESVLLSTSIDTSGDVIVDLEVQTEDSIGFCDHVLKLSTGVSSEDVTVHLKLRVVEAPPRLSIEPSVLDFGKVLPGIEVVGRIKVHLIDMTPKTIEIKSSANYIIVPLSKIDVTEGNEIEVRVLTGSVPPATHYEGMIEVLTGKGRHVVLVRLDVDSIESRNRLVGKITTLMKDSWPEPLPFFRLTHRSDLRQEVMDYLSQGVKNDMLETITQDGDFIVVFELSEVSEEIHIPFHFYENDLSGSMSLFSLYQTGQWKLTSSWWTTNGPSASGSEYLRNGQLTFPCHVSIHVIDKSMALYVDDMLVQLCKSETLFGLGLRGEGLKGGSLKACCLYEMKLPDLDRVLPAAEVAREQSPPNQVFPKAGQPWVDAETGIAFSREPTQEEFSVKKSIDTEARELLRKKAMQMAQYTSQGDAFVERFIEGGMKHPKFTPALRKRYVAARLPVALSGDEAAQQIDEIYKGFEEKLEVHQRRVREVLEKAAQRVAQQLWWF